MRLAILTDIHGNREAFAAVLADVAARAVDRIALLGDIVGYGADPCWCCERAAALVEAGAICVRGNHDSAASGTVETMSGPARLAIGWTRRQLLPGHRAFLAGLPLRVREGEAEFVHASASRPEAWSYVTSDRGAAPSFRATDARLIFCGHVHVPFLASQDLSGAVRAVELRIGRPVPLLRSRRWLAVVGSVGQPRDGQPQAGWALLDTATGELCFRRTPYDLALAAQKIRAAGLPEALASRLLRGG